MLNVQGTTILMVKVNKTEFCKHLRYKMTQICIARGTNVSNLHLIYVSSWLHWMSSSKYIRAWCLSSLDYVRKNKIVITRPFSILI